MSKHLLFRDHKAFVITDKWNYKTRKYAYDETEIKTLFPFLGYTVEFGRNFLFRDLWRFVEAEAAMFEIVFSAEMGGFPLQPFIDESRGLGEPVVEDMLNQEGIHRLEFYHSKELDYFDDGPSYSEYIGFHGIGLGRHEFSKTPNKLVEERFSLSFTTMNELMNYPLSLEADLVLYTRPLFKKGVKFKLRETKLGKASYTVGDILGAVFDEISFYGLPEKRNKEMKQLDDQVKELEKDKKDGIDKKGRNKKTGKQVLHSHDDVMKDFKKKDAENAAKDKKVAPALIAKYQKLLKKHGDKEYLPVKKFYMENRSNKTFRSAADKIPIIA